MAADHLSTFVELIYRAGVQEVSWREVVAALAPHFGGVAAVLYDRDYGPNATFFEESQILGYSPAQVRAFKEHYRKIDIRIDVADSVSAGHVYVDDHDIPFSQIAGTEIHNDFYRPAGVGHVTGLVLAKQGRSLGVLSIHRAAEFGAFRPRELRLLQALTPHLIRARGIDRMLRSAAAKHDAATTALDRFQTAVLLVDQQGMLRSTNAAADEILRVGDPLFAAAGILRAKSHKEQTTLYAAIQGAATGVAVRTPAPIVRLSAGPGRPPLRIMVMPSRGLDQVAGSMALLFVSAAGSPAAVVPAIMTAEFDLTPAEARSVAALVEGSTVGQIAALHGRSEETVRTQLKQAMAKIGVRTQAQLVAASMRSLANLKI